MGEDSIGTAKDASEDGNNQAKSSVWGRERMSQAEDAVMKFVEGDGAAVVNCIRRGLVQDLHSGMRATFERLDIRNNFHHYKDEALEPMADKKAASGMEQKNHLLMD